MLLGSIWEFAILLSLDYSIKCVFQAFYFLNPTTNSELHGMCMAVSKNGSRSFDFDVSYHSRLISRYFTSVITALSSSVSSSYELRHPKYMSLQYQNTCLGLDEELSTLNENSNLHPPISRIIQIDPDLNYL